MNSLPEIVGFDKSLHDRSGFSCGRESIDNFFKSSLSGQLKADLITAFVAVVEGDNSVLGFYTLRASVVRSDLGPKAWRRAAAPDAPSIYVRTIAVREDQQGKGLGTALMTDLMKRCLRVSDQIGASSITLDVLLDDHFDRRRKFYSDLGFHPLSDPDHARRMYIEMSDVGSTFL